MTRTPFALSLPHCSVPWIFLQKMKNKNNELHGNPTINETVISLCLSRLSCHITAVSASMILTRSNKHQPSKSTIAKTSICVGSHWPRFSLVWLTYAVPDASPARHSGDVTSPADQIVPDLISELGGVAPCANTCRGRAQSQSRGTHTCTTCRRAKESVGLKRFNWE